MTPEPGVANATPTTDAAAIVKNSGLLAVFRPDMQADFS
jgi:hypothetical protein